jgi:hypothetical protein
MKGVSTNTVRLFLGSLAVVAIAALGDVGMVHAEPVSAAQGPSDHAAHAKQAATTPGPTTTVTVTVTEPRPTKTVTKTLTKTKCHCHCECENNINNNNNNNNDNDNSDNNDNEEPPWGLPLAR